MRDGFALAEKLRIGAIKTRVYKGLGEFRVLRELSRAHGMMVSDLIRTKNRIKSIYRSRGIPTGGKEVYSPAARERWLKKLPANVRPLAEILYQELDAVGELQGLAEKKMLSEARTHRIYRLLKTCPGMGPIGVAQMLPIVVTPYRFSNKRSFWAYAGMAIVTRSSSDWMRAPDGHWERAPVQWTRGLNRNYNRVLKQIFKGAATASRKLECRWCLVLRDTVQQPKSPARNASPSGSTVRNLASHVHRIIYRYRTIIPWSGSHLYCAAWPLRLLPAGATRRRVGIAPTGNRRLVTAHNLLTPM